MSKDKENLAVKRSDRTVIKEYQNKSLFYYNSKKYMLLEIYEDDIRIEIPKSIKQIDIDLAKQNIKIPDLPCNIEILRIFHYSPKIFPENLPKNLKTLYIDSVGLAKFNIFSKFPDLSYLKKLENITIDYRFKDETIPENFLPKNLKKMYIVNCLPERFPESIEKLTLFTKKKELQDISYLKNLRKINISLSSLEKFPEKLPESIKTIDLYRNKIKSVPDISYLKNLTVLDLHSNCIKEFPKKLPVSLIDLSLSDNLIEKVNNTGYLKKLLRLSLSANKIKEFPKKLPESLLILEITNCLIEKVPDLSYIKNLSLLSIFHNPIKSIHEKTPRKDMTIQVNPDFDFRY